MLLIRPHALQDREPVVVFVLACDDPCVPMRLQKLLQGATETSANLLLGVPVQMQCLGNAALCHVRSRMVAQDTLSTFSAGI